jgi:hypothetical protein
MQVVEPELCRKERQLDYGIFLLATPSIGNSRHHAPTSRPLKHFAGWMAVSWTSHRYYSCPATPHPAHLRGAGNTYITDYTTVHVRDERPEQRTRGGLPLALTKHRCDPSG